jgi:hypothetical protein
MMLTNRLKDGVKVTRYLETDAEINLDIQAKEGNKQSDVGAELNEE